MVQHFEKEMELNGLRNPDTTSLTGINNIGEASSTNQERPQKVTDPCFGCNHLGHLLHNCRKTNRDKRLQKTAGSALTTPSEMSQETKDCYSGANWANHPSWWKTPKSTPQILFPSLPSKLKKPSVATNSGTSNPKKNF